MAAAGAKRGVGRPPGGSKPPGSGRAPGVPNKTTRAAREAIAMFVDGNAHRLQQWLDNVANGVPQLDENGVQLMDDRGNLSWVIPPNPEKAFVLFQSVVEYHVPKLARSELVGDGGGPVAIEAIDMKGLSDTELAQMRSMLSRVTNNTGG